MNFRLIVFTLFSIANAQWKPDEWMNCTLLQAKRDVQDFSLDVRNDPILGYKADRNMKTNLHLHIYINGESIMRDTEEMDPCLDSGSQCMRFFMLSLQADISEYVRRASTYATRVSFNFKDSTAKVLFVRTKLCGEFSWSDTLGMWEAVDRAYINANVKIWDGDQAVKSLSDELRRKYFHSSLATSYDSSSSNSPSISKTPVKSQVPKSRPRRAHASRHLFDSLEFEDEH